jgi:hypothetical protein
VLKSKLNINDDEFIDLLDLAWVEPIRLAFETFSGKFDSLPDQTAKRRDLDCDVLNHACEQVFPRDGIHIAAIRAPFDEGNPVFPGSKILTHSHVQVVIRDQDAIEDTKIVS